MNSVEKSAFGAYILAGGKSSRMGEDKGIMLLDGKPMVTYLIESIVKATGITPVIIANTEEYEQFGCNVIPDIIREKGPMGGIYTALDHTTEKFNLIVPCDTPFLDSAIITMLLEKSGETAVTVPWSGGRLHPLTGVYSKSVKECLHEHLLSGKLRAEDFIRLCGVKVVDTGGLPVSDMKKCFENINSKEDLKRLGYGI